MSVDGAHADDPLLDGRGVVTRARALAVQRATEAGRADLAQDLELVAGELVTNALLHGGGCRGIDVTEVADGLRIEVRDYTSAPPLFGHASEESLTGRGVRLVAGLAARWGVGPEPGGKVVWAEVTGQAGGDGGIDEDALLAMWGDDWDDDPAPRFHVELGDVPTDLLLAAKSHVDNIVREFALAAGGADSGVTADLPLHLTALVDAVDRFAEARLAIKHHALEAVRRGEPMTRLSLDLPADAADAAEEYLAALDEVDAYCRAMRMLTLETPPQHRLFRHWYVSELVTQLRAAAAGEEPPTPQPFERRILVELDRLVTAHRASERAARLYAVAAALATADSPEAVAAATLSEGVAALGASAGGILLATDADKLSVPGAVGYDEEVLARLRDESRDAELPAAVALRTGEPVWLESRAERDRRFPELAGLEAKTVSLCAVPLQVQGRRLGAIRFSFNKPRLFDEDERRFVLTLAAQTAQALDRTQLQLARLDASRRLQRSLLPRTMPDIPGIDLAAIYHPFADGMEVGGDFYDVWPIERDRWAVAIGDATGTGPEAAALTALVRNTLRTLTMTESDPDAVVRRLNSVLMAAAYPDEERFCTAVFGVLDIADGITLALAGGGHPPLFLRHATGVVETVPVGGALLGAFPDPVVGTTRVSLGIGDTAVLLTDGVLEARGHGALFDYAGVERVLAEGLPDARAAGVALEQAVLSHTDGALSDDVAAVIIHVVARSR